MSVYIEGVKRNPKTLTTFLTVLTSGKEKTLDNEETFLVQMHLQPVLTLSNGLQVRLYAIKFCNKIKVYFLALVFQLYLDVYGDIKSLSLT